MNVLVVDDDETKLDRVCEVATNAVGSQNIEITCLGNAADARLKLESVSFDVFILDLNLPRRKGETPNDNAGIQLLTELSKFGPRFKAPKYILGITSYDHLEITFQERFQSLGWTLVHYAPESDHWAQSVENTIRHAFEIGGQRSAVASYGKDLAIITALKDTELQEVLELPASWERIRYPGDDTFYHLGCFQRNQHRVSVVAAAAPEMGMAASACLSMKMIHTFRPRYLAMAGISAGIKSTLGDILFADKVWDYGSGKLRASSTDTETEFDAAPNQISVDPFLKECADSFKQSGAGTFADIRQRWKFNSVPPLLDMHIGPVACGAAVVESKEVVESIIAQHRKVTGVEMETFGVFMAGRVCSEPRPKVFSAKSVCDKAVSPKTDDFQRYAAYTSAQFVYEFSLAMLSQ